MFANLSLVKEYLKSCDMKNRCSGKLIDGRYNSILDETTILKLLQRDEYINSVIRVPTKKRHWHDFSILNDYGAYVPVNIKSTTGTTHDNVGNLTVIIQSYTDYELDIDTHYNNGKLSKIYMDCIDNNLYNTSYCKDYYFLVINKNSGDVIINSVLGLSDITYNINNLPFQVKWKNNKHYIRNDILTHITRYNNAYKISRNWKYDFFNWLKN